MIKYPIAVVCLLFLSVSCKTGSILEEQQNKTTQQVTLGGIGSGKDFILQTGFNNVALPTYQEPIRTTVINKVFNKQAYKLFTKAKALQSADINIHYIDSIPNKPNYLQLQIADKVEVIKALNMEDNKEIKNYLSHDKNDTVLTSILIAFNKYNFDDLLRVDYVTLI